MITASSLSNNTLTVIVDNSTVLSATKDHPQWVKLVNAYNSKDQKALLELLSMKRAVEKYSSGGLTVVENGVFYNNVALHGIDVDRLLAYMRQGLPYKPIANYMARKLNNPSARSVREMYNFLEHRRMPLNDNGCIVAYKGVQGNYYSCSSGAEPLISGKRNDAGQIYNGIGETIEMPRNYVDDDFRQGCSGGLHAGSLEYARGFGDITLLVEIDPADVVSVPSDCNCQKLRCCKYTVLGEYKGPLPDTYAQDLNSKGIDPVDEEEREEEYDEYYGENTDKSEMPELSEKGASIPLDIETRKKLIEIIVEQLGISETEIFDDKRFVEDFHCDSHDLVELVMAVEDEFGFEIPDDVTESINTVGDALAQLIPAAKMYTDTGSVNWNSISQTKPNIVHTFKTDASAAPTKSQKVKARRDGYFLGKKHGKARDKRVYRSDEVLGQKDPLIAIYAKAYNKGYFAGRTDNKGTTKRK